MPLNTGSGDSIVSHNIKEMMKSGHTHAQSVAAALHNAHPQHASRGGKFRTPATLAQVVQAHPMAASAAAARSIAAPQPQAPQMAGGGMLTHMRPMKLKNPKLGGHPMHMGGLFTSTVPGRTDRHNVSVPSDSYIVPADVVSAGLGQGNSLAGGKVLDHMFGAGKGLTGGSFASGGAVPITVAGGEYHIMPEAVKRLGNGNVSHGHRVLDEFVKHVRNKAAKEMLKLPGPKQ